MMTGSNAFFLTLKFLLASVMSYVNVELFFLQGGVWIELKKKVFLLRLRFLPAGGVARFVHFLWSCEFHNSDKNTYSGEKNATY